MTIAEIQQEILRMKKEQVYMYQERIILEMYVLQHLI